MQTDRWHRIEEVFQAALERTAGSRKSFLEDLCGDDGELLEEVRSLLDHEQSAENILGSVVEQSRRELGQVSESSEVGLRIGPYLLVRELDSGGMGVVHLAVRSDDQYIQVVAIKMIRQGMSSPAVIQRFRDERQTLATLNHPNIGAILDGGETDDGRPYIVMEYVEGQAITLASVSRGLDIRQRLEWFRFVCAAVHHAHQKLIIHRDIKPSNVLVTPEGTVKLIDFGISKPVAAEFLLSDRAPTETSHRLFTPDYASPEQLLGKQLTTGTDIYSLGVLLFELLTSSRPYTLHDLSPARAEQLLLAEERYKPSAVPGLPRRLKQELSGDLDRIVMMAMEHDPSRRYLSVQHLEEDLLRYLQGRPVTARKASVLYSLAKFIDRHHTAILAACIAMLVVLSSLFVYRWQSRTAARKVLEVSMRADSAIAEMADKLQHSATSVEAQAAVFHQALDSLDQLRRTMGNDPPLLLELSNAYLRVGDFEGSPDVANLGHSGTAVSSYECALQTAIRARDRVPDMRSTLAVIRAYQHLGGIHTFLGDLRQATNDYQHSLSLARSLWPSQPQDQLGKSLLAGNYAGMGNAELANLRPDYALHDYEAAFSIFGKSSDGNEEHDLFLAELYLSVGSALNEIGDQPEALRDEEQAVYLAQKLVEANPLSVRSRRELFMAYENIILPLAGRSVMNVSDERRSQLYARKGLAIAQLLASSDTQNVQASYDLALAFAREGDANRLAAPLAAARWYRKSIRLTASLAPSYGAEARHWMAIRDEALADVLVDTGQLAEKYRTLREANAIRQELADTSPHARLHLMRSYCKLADTDLETNRLSMARQDVAAASLLLNEFSTSSPSMLVLRDVGYCLETEGNVERRVAAEPGISDSQRSAAQKSARAEYQRSADVWEEWVRRGAATPESEHERHHVERLLRLLWAKADVRTRNRVANAPEKSSGVSTDG